MPTLTDYVQTLFTLFDRFMQAQSPTCKRGGPFLYANKTLIVFFIILPDAYFNLLILSRGQMDMFG